MLGCSSKHTEILGDPKASYLHPFEISLMPFGITACFHLTYDYIHEYVCLTYDYIHECVHLARDYTYERPIELVKITVCEKEINIILLAYNQGMQSKILPCRQALKIKSVVRTLLIPTPHTHTYKPSYIPFSQTAYIFLPINFIVV